MSKSNKKLSKGTIENLYHGYRNKQNKNYLKNVNAVMTMKIIC